MSGSLLTFTSYAAAGVVGYYLLLFVVSLWTTRRTHGRAEPEPTFVIVVPAHNEELVIEQTVGRLLELDWERYIALVMNDGSRDRTSELARRVAADDERVLVVDRPPELAGRGKGDVLNHAYRIVSAMALEGDRRLKGAEPDRIVVCVIDADGWLEPHALAAVAPYYSDPHVAGVQLPVRMWNARNGFLTLLQDMEFIGFSLFVQAGRDPFGSVGLGGNGQFVRLSALQSVGRSPWSKCLTEDLDLSLTLVEAGWRNRFCPRACVAQQALTGVGALMRQRTRWTQGHYSCWQHLPSLWRAHAVPVLTRLDLSLYLLLAAFVLVLAVHLALGIVSWLGIYPVDSAFLSFVEDDTAYRAVTLSMALAPVVAFAITYQRYARVPVPLWALPGLLLIFAAYNYGWGIPANLWALARLMLGRQAWVKTPRVAVTADDIAAERASLAQLG